MRLAEFAGTGRFEVRRRIGAGGMGVVYEAHDHQRGMRVAIKTLSRLDAAALYRLKHEFRSLADIVHENLVRFHELVSEGDEWFFVMDLVAGLDLLTYVWGYGPGYRAEPSRAPVLDETLPAPSGVRPSAAPPPPRPLAHTTSSPAALARLRSSLRQLVAAIAAVHEAGKLHRDVKPANVLVESSGRVVLLDFGLATDVHEAGDAHRDATGGSGTPAYMAPEQAAGARHGTAADWYAVGAVLFEALTGRVPFTGSPLAVIVAKQTIAAARPSELVAGVPPDLDDLCADLLAIDPEARPDGAEILRRLDGVVPAPPSSGVVAAPSSMHGHLVGRATPLATLRLAFEAVRAGRPAFAQVVGPSGIGKTALVRHALAAVEAAEGGVVLAGRCYQHESVPYKGFDAIVDGLSHHLSTLPAEACAELVPRDPRALLRVFPVLGRIDAFAKAPHPAVDLTDPHQIRTSAFGALREVLGKLGRRKPLVLFIDDFQWADADSAALLAEMTAPPDAPVVLVVIAYRSEDVDAQPWLTSVARTGRPSSAPVSSTAGAAPFTCVLTLEALGEGDARMVVAELLDAEGDDPRVASIAGEAGGSPFFLGELARYALAHEGTDVRLEDVVESRVRSLPPAALSLLEVIAVAGHPIDRATALAAASLGAREGDAGLAAMRAAHLVRAHPGPSERVEPYHDRIRETMLATLPRDKRRVCHARLAEALVARGEDDPDVLFAHFEGAGDRARAASYAEAAAARATSLLAFERASVLYQRALDLTDGPLFERHRLRLLVAESLARAGRGALAADVYMTAAGETEGAARLDLRKKASEQLLFSGHIDRGMDLVKQVLGEEGMHLAPTPLLALAGLLLVRLAVLLRGRRHGERPESEVPAAILARVDTCNVVANGLSFVDNIQGRLFQARAMLLALGAGEPSRIAHAFAGEAIFQAASGWRSQPRALALLEEAERVCARTGIKDKAGTIEYARGMVLHVTGDWVRAHASFERAEQLLDGVGDRSFRVELDGALSYGTTVLVLLGRLREASRRHATLRREAEDRGDLFLGTNLSIGFSNQCWLFADDPATARTVAAEAMARWSPRGFHLQHWHELLALTFIDLYDGQPERALERLRSQWRPLRRSMLMRLQITAGQARYLRATASLAVAARLGSNGRAHIDAALRDAAALDAIGARWTAAHAALVRGTAASLAGDRGEAERSFAAAMEGFEALELKLFAAVARRRLGEVRGGSEGAALAGAADAWMTAEGIRRPDRIARMIAPAAAA